jgi:OmpA-OmpF porin, OOP family
LSLPAESIKEEFMKKICFIILMIVSLSISTAGLSSGEPDAQGCKDHPLFNRMAGYSIVRCEQKEFDSRSFRDAKLNEIVVEGRVQSIVYGLIPGAKEASRLQILRNYENAIKKIGGTVLKSDWDGVSFMKVNKDGKEIWVQISAYMSYQPDITIVEKAAMTQEIVADAAAFSRDIKETGRTAIYGIYFDTGKAVIKPESDSTLAEIARLLKNNSGLNISVVGHTDNVGGVDANMTLSQARADAVVKALSSRHGIDPKKMKAYGVGPLSPMASNRTEEGRAKNRRVELVER